jgi:DNA-directed RNA polymerase specialized sigma24 family protein
LRNYLRDKKKNIEILSEDHISTATNLCYEEQDEIPESEKMHILKEELEKLQDWERMLLLLKAQQMPYSEIAKFIDKPENQLKVYYARLKKKITEAIILKTEVNHV